jgi:hypothetical protein
VNLSFDELEQLFTNATAAEAEVTGKHQKDVARDWALQYADAAAVLLPRNKAALNLITVARANRSPEGPYEPTVAVFKLVTRMAAVKPGSYLYAYGTISAAVRSLSDAYPIHCLTEAAVMFHQIKTKPKL